MCVVGADGLPPCDNAGNVLRSNTSLRLSFRTPPLVDAKAALEAVIRTLTENVPCGAQVTVSRARSRLRLRFAAAFRLAARDARGRRRLDLRQQHGLPLLRRLHRHAARLQGRLPDEPSVNTGALGPTRNAHAPNEWLDLAYAEKLTCVFAELIAGIPSEN